MSAATGVADATPRVRAIGIIDEQHRRFGEVAGQIREPVTQPLDERLATRYRRRRSLGSPPTLYLAINRHARWCATKEIGRGLGEVLADLDNGCADEIACVDDR
ncbi:hypothetical protein BH23ACT10_BH23ACT10_23910 [soil metagenome]